MKKVLLLVATAALALGAAQLASADASNPDPAGDSGTAPDITTVTAAGRHHGEPDVHGAHEPARARRGRDRRHCVRHRPELADRWQRRRIRLRHGLRRLGICALGRGAGSMTSRTAPCRERQLYDRGRDVQGRQGRSRGRLQVRRSGRTQPNSMRAATSSPRTQRRTEATRTSTSRSHCVPRRQQRCPRGRWPARHSRSAPASPASTTAPPSRPRR